MSYSLRLSFLLSLVFVAGVGLISPYVAHADPQDECYTYSVCDIVGGTDCHSDTVGGGGYWECDTPYYECNDYTECDWTDDGGSVSCDDVGLIPGSDGTCTLPPAPDIAVSNFVPTTAYVGLPTSLQTFVSNIGQLPTKTYLNFFLSFPGQAVAYSFTNELGSVDAGNVNPGDLFPVAKPYTFTSPGVYMGIICATPYFSGSESSTYVSQRNYDNDCTNQGQWAAINVINGAPAPTVNLSATPSSIVAGNSTQVSWSSANATSCTGDGNLNTGGATSGSVTSWPGATTTYHVACTGPGGTTDAYAPVTVTAAQCGDGIDNDGNGLTDMADPGCTGPTDTTESGGVLPSVSCNVSPTTVPTGGSATYTATPASGASGPYTWTTSDGMGGLGSGSTAVRSFAGLGTYGMSVRASGTGSPSTTCPQVSVNTCSGTKTGTITASPNRVNQGSSTTLTWSAQNITSSCTVSGPGVSQTTGANSCAVPSASLTTPGITTQSVYTLTCDGTVLGSVIVNVVPKIEEF